MTDVRRRVFRPSSSTCFVYVVESSHFRIRNSLINSFSKKTVTQINITLFHDVFIN